MRNSFLFALKYVATTKVKKAYPARYTDAQRTLEGIGYAIRKMYPKQFITDLAFEGTTLNLIYRAKTPGVRTEWKIKEGFNPLDVKTLSEPILERSASTTQLCWLNFPKN